MGRDYVCGVGTVGWSQGQAEQGAWVVLTMHCGCLRGVERLGAGLAAVAVNAVVLIWKFARMNILTLRDEVEQNE